MLTKKTERIQGLIILNAELRFIVTTSWIIENLIGEGFEKEDIKEYLKEKIDKA